METQPKNRIYVVAVYAEIRNSEDTYNNIYTVLLDEPDETEQDAINMGRILFVADVLRDSKLEKDREFPLDKDDIRICYIGCREITAEDLDPNSYG
jgi:hypothetical protein